MRQKPLRSSAKRQTAWTTAQDIKARVQKLWDRGRMLSELVELAKLAAPLELSEPAEPPGRNPLFPRRFPLKKPDSEQISSQFHQVRSWIAALAEREKYYRIEWKTIQHRVMGSNRIPAAVWIDSLHQAVQILGKQNEAETFRQLVETTRQREPALTAWLARRPLRALELAEDWPLLLDFVAWVKEHPAPNIYLRQISLPNVHTKFIEQNRSVLSELLDMVLSEDVINKNHTGSGGFAHRYGFKDKPQRVRFRVLDSEIPVFAEGLIRSKESESSGEFGKKPARLKQNTGIIPDNLLCQNAAEPGLDITLSSATFALLNLPVQTVFITENEVNFLSFPRVGGAIVIFGAGYGFAGLSAARWLRRKDIYYWGDIDTHGFTILNQLRSLFPHVRSFLMDSATLHAHETLWTFEAKPQKSDLPYLTAEESAVYKGLRANLWGKQIRLEQELIRFDRLSEALKCLQTGELS